jgi:DNA polymerase IV
MTSVRSILHVDMDAFFASVEQLDNPSLRGKAVLVGHDGARGVVAAASYESRKFGCHSAQPMVVAKRLCPHAIVVKGRFERYRELSRQIHGLFERFTPIVEPVSIDEAYLDVTDSLRLHGEAVGIARTLKTLIRQQTGLTASVGVAENKFLAKLASDMNKPDGLAVIRAEDVERLLPPMSVGRIWGIGQKTEARLAEVGVRTIADLRKMPRELIDGRLGSSAEHFLELAWGRDDRQVVADSERKSIGHEQTFGVDVGDPARIFEVIVEQVEQVAWRLRKQHLLAKRVAIKVRYGDFQTISRSRTLPEATDRTDLLRIAAEGLFQTWAAQSFSPVRLIGVTAEQLGVAQAQLSLFTDPQETRAREVDRAVDAINAKFGGGVIRRGGVPEHE